MVSEETLFGEMKRYVGFTPDDTEALARVRHLVQPHYAAICEEFYERIQAHPEADAVFSGPEQVARLKQMLVAWMDRLLAGPHDEEYFRLRSRIGRTHVRVGLKQIYMFTAMNLIRLSLGRIARKAAGADEDLYERVTVALNKILDMDLAIMLESYREDYIAQIQRSARQAALERLAAIGGVVATVAHEVRNPLAGISGALEVLRDELPGGSPRREVIREALGQVRRLEERVRDLLMYARRTDLRLQDVDPEELIRSTLALMSEEPMMRQVTFDVSISSGAGSHPMDRGQMQEVLVNLIRNAAHEIKGAGQISIRAERRDQGALALIVEDTGPGIPPERLEAIFEPFYTTRPEGTGLGLSIARKTLIAHGGSLTCESTPGPGARFVAWLPPAQVLM